MSHNILIFRAKRNHAAARSPVAISALTTMKPYEGDFGILPQQVSLDVLLEKYAKGDEQTVEDVRRRVARALAAVEKDPRRAGSRVFFEALESGFIPGGRINSAAGTDLQATLINCFVQPVGDSISEPSTASPGIYVALMRGGRDHAPRRRRRLRLLVHPPPGRAGARHRQPRQRTGVVHARVRPIAARRSNRPARAAARRWASCAATIPTSRTSSTPRTTATSPTSTSAWR